VSQSIRNGLSVVLLVAMAGVIVSAFFLVSTSRTSGFAVPDAMRILFFHVPCAILCATGFAVALVRAILYLRTRDMRHDAGSLVAARLGLLFGVLAICMGMAWARVEWGQAWNWDPRQTSLALALMTFVAYFALRGAVEDPERQAALAAVYAVLASPTALFLIFGLPRFYGGSLHRKPLEVRMGPDFGATFGVSILCFLALFFWMSALETRLTLRTWKVTGRLAS
jgi:heme exporter protein C